jgi:hypothetical protein
MLLFHVEVWGLNIQLPMQSVTITTNVVSSNPAHFFTYTLQHEKGRGWGYGV